ncbi:hypothetical protein FKM82_002329 [Ascaphus truei]
MMARSMHCLVEESLLTACANLGKNLIQQCLQQEVLSSDGTMDVLSGACQAVAEEILQSVQLRIWDAGRVTQKEILSHACRELAKLIKAQCPRGSGEMVRMQGKLESVLSEGSLALKLAEVINTRELVECVCSQHYAGLGTVLLAACQWLVNDIKTLFLCEEVWGNLFGEECMVRTAFYTQMRPLLSTMVFQIKIGSCRQEKQCRMNDRIVNSGEHHNKDSGTFQKLGTKDTDKVFKKTKHQRKKGSCKNRVDEYMERGQDGNMVINNRENQLSYIIELISTKIKQRCLTTIRKLWSLLVKTDEFVGKELCDERVCYLITFAKQPVDSPDSLYLDSYDENAFTADVTVRGVGHPIWPKDKSVVKRWFPDLRDQQMEESGDCGNQCLQIWRIGSKNIEKRHPKRFSDRAVGREHLNVRRHEGSNRMYSKNTVGCFQFTKKQKKYS